MEHTQLHYVLKTSEIFPIDHELYDSRAARKVNLANTLRPEFVGVYET